MATSLKRNFDDAFLTTAPSVMGLKAEVAEASSPARSPRASSAAIRGGRRCTECGVTDTPQWRQGPAGPQSLCNACGVRHSRLLRKLRGGKSPKLSAGASPAPSWDLDSDTNSEDMSRGTVVDVSPNTPTRAMPGSPARCSPAAPTLLVKSARRAAVRLTRGASLPTSPMGPSREVAVGMAGHHEEDEHEDSEAALNLLSIAAAATSACVSTGATGPATMHEPVTIATVAATRTGSVQSALSLDGVDVMHLMHGPGLQAIVPQLGASQMQELRALCHAFDASYQELVAAHAACDAVRRVLATKRAEAGAARAATKQVLGRLVSQASAVAAEGPLKVMQAALFPELTTIPGGTAATVVAEDAASCHGDGGSASQQGSMAGDVPPSPEHAPSLEVASPRAAGVESCPQGPACPCEVAGVQEDEDEDKDEMMTEVGLLPQASA